MPQERTSHAMEPIPVPAQQRQLRQRRQMLAALGLLLLALVVVVVRNSGFWFGSGPVTETASEEVQPPVSDQTAISEDNSATGTSAADTAAPDEVATPETSKMTAPVPSAATKKHHTAPPARHAIADLRAGSAMRNSTGTSAGPIITATNRAALPPLEVEVIAGGQRQSYEPSNPSVRVDLQSGVPAAVVRTPVPAPAPATPGNTSTVAANGGEHVQMSPSMAQMVERPVEPNYPMLAKQMKVQGSVVLQALIGREGSIQDLRVLSGPAILSTAAMDAVKQWHFRPYFQSGAPVETEARITVNFTISTY